MSLIKYLCKIKDQFFTQDDLDQLTIKKCREYALEALEDNDMEVMNIFIIQEKKLRDELLLTQVYNN